MPAPVVATPVVEASDKAPAAQPDACDVCGHARTAHDSIAARYCDATQSNALARGCLCR